MLYDGGKRLIVTNSGNDTVSVIDTEKRVKIYDFSVSSQPYGVAVSPDGKRAVVTGWASGDAHFVDLGDKSATVTGKVDVGMLPYTVILPGDGNVAYVAANGSHHVATLDVSKRTLQSKIKVGRNPWSLAASGDGKFILVTNNRSNNLSLIKTGTVLPALTEDKNFIPAGSQLQANGESVMRAAKNASVSINGKKGVFTDLANNQIVLIDLETKAISKVINVGKAPYGIEFIR